VAIHKDEAWTEDRGALRGWTADGETPFDLATRRHIQAGLPFHTRRDAAELWRPVTGGDLVGPAWRTPKHPGGHATRSTPTTCSGCHWPLRTVCSADS
jgi:hypothetical protein